MKLTPLADRVILKMVVADEDEISGEEHSHNDDRQQVVDDDPASQTVAAHFCSRRQGCGILACAAAPLFRAIRHFRLMSAALQIKV